MKKIEPNAQIYGLGDDVGSIHVTPEHVYLEVGIPRWDESIILTLDPETAPLFRMIANRLDEISGKRKRMA